MLLHTPYAVCGTNSAYGTAQLYSTYTFEKVGVLIAHTAQVPPYCHSVRCFAMCGTGIAYADLRAAPTVPLHDVRYCPAVWCYVMCGTELGYGATRCV
eukprot:108561-Rhodomonas_salina.1